MSDMMSRLAAARGGDQRALEYLFARFLPSLRAFVRLRVGQKVRARESTSDLVQSIFREVLQDLHQFVGHDEKQFKKWFFTVALHKIQSRHRFHAAERRSPEREVRPVEPTSGAAADANLLDCYASFCTPSQHAVANEEAERIETAFESMPDDYRTIVTLACIIGMTHAEIAVELERSEPAVRKLLSRARARLARLLIESERQEPG